MGMLHLLGVISSTAVGARCQEPHGECGVQVRGIAQSVGRGSRGDVGRKREEGEEDMPSEAAEWDLFGLPQPCACLCKCYC